MTAESDEKAASQIDRLIALGYAVMDVTPPLTDARSPPHQR